MNTNTVTWVFDNEKRYTMNVPVVNSDDGERLFEGSVSLRISEIAEFMTKNDLYEFDFNHFKLNAPSETKA